MRGNPHVRFGGRPRGKGSKLRTPRRAADPTLSPKRPVPREPDVLDTNGRGLGVVKELSLSYGCDHRGRWKVVWALLDGR
jgi:hypothetical protein